MLPKLTALSVLGFLTLTANASQLLRLDVDQDADVYEVHVVMELDASPESVRAILTDYANLDRLNGSITANKVLGSTRGGTVRVLTRFRDCILFFCTKIQKVEDITEDDQGRILVSLVPDLSSFRSGQASWEILSTDNGTRVVHYAKLEPDVWIPPWIGTALLKDTLRREIAESLTNLDCLARRRCERAAEFALEDFTQDT